MAPRGPASEERLANEGPVPVAAQQEGATLVATVIDNRAGEVGLAALDAASGTLLLAQHVEATRNCACTLCVHYWLALCLLPLLLLPVLAAGAPPPPLHSSVDQSCRCAAAAVDCRGLLEQYAPQLLLVVAEAQELGISKAATQLQTQVGAHAVGA